MTAPTPQYAFSGKSKVTRKGETKPEPEHDMVNPRNHRKEETHGEHQGMPPPKGTRPQEDFYSDTIQGNPAARPILLDSTSEPPEDEEILFDSTREPPEDEGGIEYRHSQLNSLEHPIGALVQPSVPEFYSMHLVEAYKVPSEDSKESSEGESVILAISEPVGRNRKRNVFAVFALVVVVAVTVGLSVSFISNRNTNSYENVPSPEPVISKEPEPLPDLDGVALYDCFLPEDDSLLVYDLCSEATNYDPYNPSGAYSSNRAPLSQHVCSSGGSTTD